MAVRYSACLMPELWFPVGVQIEKPCRAHISSEAFLNWARSFFSKCSFLPLLKLTELTMKWECICAASECVATITSWSLHCCCKLQGSSVSFLRSYIFIRVERLHKMKIHFTVTLAMLKFRADELCIAYLRLAVDTCNHRRSLKVVFFSCTTYFSTADRPARFWPLGLLIAVTVAMSHTFFSRISLSIFWISK